MACPRMEDVGEWRGRRCDGRSSGSNLGGGDRAKTGRRRGGGGFGPGEGCEMTESGDLGLLLS